MPEVTQRQSTDLTSAVAPPSSNGSFPPPLISVPLCPIPQNADHAKTRQKDRRWKPIAIGSPYACGSLKSGQLLPPVVAAAAEALAETGRSAPSGPKVNENAQNSRSPLAVAAKPLASGTSGGSPTDFVPRKPSVGGGVVMARVYTPVYRNALETGGVQRSPARKPAVKVRLQYRPL